ncbi:MAG: GatB/YqeY domain-containing protein [Actinomycetota bacterium]|nr:GatB/YqeY domain-containing protein [Actinomycetota bacterium]
MAELKDRLRADLTAAMKARDALRSSTLRLALTAVANAEVSGKQARELSDDEVTTVLVAQAKRRREAAEAFDGAGRIEQAAKERAEAELLADYLPQPLSDEDLVALVTATVAEVAGAGRGMSAMGQVMGRLKPQVSGRADGAAVAAEVRRQLTG